MNTPVSGTEPAALQQARGRMQGALPAFWREHAFRPAGRATVALPRLATFMTASPPRQVVIRGVTRDGRTFRPSDWAERLAGAMSSFRPQGVRGGIGAYIGYSPYCVPRVIDGVKCVLVSEALKGLEPMAWDFVMNFARDNQLEVAEADPAREQPSS